MSRERMFPEWICFQQDFVGYHQFHHTRMSLPIQVLLRDSWIANTDLGSNLFILIHTQSPYLCSARLVPKHFPWRDEGSDKLSATIKPDRIPNDHD